MNIEDKKIYYVEIYVLLPSDDDPAWYFTVSDKYQNNIDLSKIKNMTVSRLYKTGKIKEAKLIFQNKYINPKSLLSVGGGYVNGVGGKMYFLDELNKYESVE